MSFDRFLLAVESRNISQEFYKGLILCSKKKILGVESRDFSQAEKEMTAC